MLYGKGVWAWQEPEVDVAIQMACAIDATHVIFRTGSGAFKQKSAPAQFHADAARRALVKIAAAHLTPFAWIYVYGDDPDGEARIAAQLRDAGYRGIVFDIEGEAANKHANIAALGRQILAAGIDPRMLYFSSYPNLTTWATIPYGEMNAFCAGGFFPQAYATFGKPAEYTLGAMTYEQPWNPAWGSKPDYYPVLGLYYDLHGAVQMTATEFRLWAGALASYRPTFYSVYRAGVTRREIWQMLKMLEPCGVVKTESATSADWQAAAARAWQIAAVPSNPDFAFPKKAWQVLGVNAIALSEEQRMHANGYVWAWQLWTDGKKTVVLMTQDGHWEMDEIRAIVKGEEWMLDPIQRRKVV